MKGKVFVSCGQRPHELEVARAIQVILTRRGFNVYLAINAQTILEINSGIIGELKQSDCYLFVNFRREPIGDQYRGSLFSHQELAIAYAFGFERILVVNQCGVLSEGMLGYIGINTEQFAGPDDCCAVVERALDRSGWTPEYVRRLRANSLHFSDELLVFGNLVGRFLYVDVTNGRPDIAALEATARLAEYGPVGEPLRPSPIRSPLKATARPGFAHTIFPKSHEAFDLLCVGTYRTQVQPDWNDQGVYLNSALDVAGAGRLPITAGVWTLRYEFYAIDFRRTGRRRTDCTPASTQSILHRLPHTLRDHGWIIVNCEGHGALKSMRPRDEHAKPAIESVGGDLRFMRATRVPVASDNCRLDALAAVTGNTWIAKTVSGIRQHCSGVAAGVGSGGVKGH